MTSRLRWSDLRLPLMLLLITALAILSSAVRLVILAITPETEIGQFDLFDQRYFLNRTGMWLHVLPGLLFLVLGIVQFMPAMRRRSPHLHRWMGRVALASGLMSALVLYWLAFSLPAMGGALTIAGTYVFASWMIISLIAAWWAIRRRQTALHRAFMIRAYAIGSAVATIRLLGILGDMVFGINFQANFGLWLWIGMSLHLIAAELILGQVLSVTARPVLRSVILPLPPER